MRVSRLSLSKPLAATGLNQPDQRRSAHPERRCSYAATKLADVEGLNSKLNLNAGAPPRVWPKLGEWGPVNVPSTRQKKRLRWFVALGFVAAAVVLFLYGWYIFTMMQAAGGG